MTMSGAGNGRTDPFDRLRAVYPVAGLVEALMAWTRARPDDSPPTETEIAAYTEGYGAAAGWPTPDR